MTVVKGINKLILAAFAFALAAKAEGTNVTVCVMTAHAMSHGLRIVGEFYDKSVNLEEPGYYDDLSRSEQSAPGRDYRLAKAYTLDFSFASTSTVEEAIGAILAANIQANPSVTYCVVTNRPWPEVYTVIPEQWKGGTGVQRGLPSILATHVTIGMHNQESLIGRLNRALLDVSPYDDEILMNGHCDSRHWSSVNPYRTFTNEMALSVLNTLFCDPHGKERGSWHYLRNPKRAGKRTAFLDIRYAPQSNAHEMDRFVVSFNERPLANALPAVSRDIHRPIGYEDPDLSKSCYSGIDAKPYRSAGANNSFAYHSAWSYKRILDAMAQNVVIGNCNFRIEEKDGVFCVLPHRKYIIRQGTQTEEPYQPISANVVGVAIDNTNACAVVSEICRQLGETSGKKIVMSKEAEQILLTMHAPLKVKGVPGWFALSTYLKGISESLNWRLLHKPATDKYVFDIYDWTRPIVIMGGDPSQPPESGL